MLTGSGWTDSRIAEAFNGRVQTVEILRKRRGTEGVALACEGQKPSEPPAPPKLAGEAET